MKTVEEIIKLIDESIKDLSIAEAIDFLEEVSASVESSLDYMECDLTHN